MLIKPLNPHVLRKENQTIVVRRPPVLWMIFHPSPLPAYVTFYHQQFHTFLVLLFWFDRVLVTCTFSFHLFGLKLNHRKSKSFGLFIERDDKIHGFTIFPPGMNKRSFSGCCESMAIPFFILTCVCPSSCIHAHTQDILRCLLFTLSPSLVVLLFKKRCLFTLIY